MIGAAVHRWWTTLLGLGRSSLALALLELEAERRRWVRMWLASLWVLFAALCATAMGLAWLLWRVDPALRATWAGWLCVAFVGLSGAGLWVLYRELAYRSFWVQSLSKSISSLTAKTSLAPGWSARQPNPPQNGPGHT